MYFDKSKGKTMKKLLVAILIGAMVIGMAGCSAGKKSNKGNEKDAAGDQTPVIKVALLSPLTGVAASWGERTSNGFELAAQLFNEAGGVKSLGGAKIETVVVDTESKPEVASSQAEKLVQDGDIYVLSGCNSSAASLVVSQACERANVTFLTGSDADPLITQRKFKYTFRTATLMTDHARDIMTYIKAKNDAEGGEPLKVALLSINSVLGKTANSTAQKCAEEFGWEVVDNSVYDPSTTKDFTGYISKYKNAGVDVLLCDSNTDDAIRITQTIKELDFNPKAFGGMYGALCSADYWSPLGSDADYVLATTVFNMEMEVPGIDEVSRIYEETYGVEFDDVSVLGFNAFAAISQAIEDAGAADREAVHQAIANLEMSIGDNNLFQVNGVKFNESGDNIYARSVVEEIKDGKAYVVYPEEFKQTEGVWPRPEWSEIN